MKKVYFLCLILLVLILIEATSPVSANWYAGSEFLNANGIWAYISTPVNLNIIELDQSGEANWVSTIYPGSNGDDWIQAGWKFFHWYTDPKQFIEWCIDCTPQGGTHAEQDTFAIQNWNSQVDYMVENITGQRWCAYTGGIQRFCVDNLHGGGVKVMAKSEVFTSSLNPLETNFSQVRYKNPNDNIWYLFDNRRNWINNFPYDIEKFSNSHFRTYRVNTPAIYLPVILK